MVTIRKSGDRGATRLDWLDSRHTFSFGDYFDRRHMKFGPLRVINEDRVEPATGFGMHPHRDMEILTWVLDGALAHRDTLGNGSVIRPGDVQRMSAGTGILHSEENPSRSEPVHFLQIWIEPERTGAPPEYEQRTFEEKQRRGKLLRVAGRGGGDGAVTVHQDVDLYASILPADAGIGHDLGPGRRAWLQVARGAVTLNGNRLSEGDGAAVVGETRLDLVTEGPHEAEFLLFDLP